MWVSSKFTYMYFRLPLGGANDLKGLSCKPPFLYQKCRASQEVSACTELGGGVDDNREARGGEHVTRNERHANQRELET